MKQVDVIFEAILNPFGYTQSKRRVNRIFSTQDITETRVKSLKNNLDSTSISVIDALIYLSKNKHKKYIKAKMLPYILNSII